MSYGNRFKCLRVSGYTEFTKYGGEIFEVDLALVFQSDDAAADLRRLLEEVENARPDEWFDLDDQSFERLSNLGEQRGSRARPTDAGSTLSSLLNSDQSSRAHRPERRASRERESQPASQPSPRRRRSTAHRSTNRATSIPVQRDDNNAPAASGRNSRSRFIAYLIVIALLLGVLYGSITSRDPLADVMNLAETAISAGGSLAQPTPTARPRRLSKPKVKIASRSATSIRFSWDKVPLAQDYQYRHSLNGRGASFWRTTSASSITVSALSPGDRLQFFVRARHESGILSTTARISASTVTDRAPTATDLPPTATDLPPTATDRPPTATDRPPTATDIPPTATDIPPTATDIPPTATRPPPTSTATDIPPSATDIPPTATDIPPTATDTATPTDVPPEIFFVETAQNHNAHIRACPSTSCEIVAKLAPGTAVDVIGAVKGETVYETDIWLELDFEGGSAFIHSELVAQAG